MIKILSILVISFVLFSSCQKEEKNDYFRMEMKAEVNGMFWSTDRANFQMDYDYDRGYHTTHIGSDCEERLADGTRYEISFSHSYRPGKGKFYFNNDKYTVPYEGASGHVIARTIDDHYFGLSSCNGFFEITEMTRTRMKGIFEFDAIYTIPEGHVPDATIDTVKIRNGIFDVPLTLTTGAPWNYP